jgi:chromosome segregation ATPase
MQAKVSQQRVLELQDKLIGIQDLLSDNKKAEAIKKKKIDLKNEQNTNLKNQIKVLQNQIKIIKHQAGELFGFPVYTLKLIDKKTKDKIQNLKTQITALNVKINNNRNEINSLNNFFTFSDTKAKIKTAIENLNAFMSEVFDVFLTWVIMFFFKNIFFPILFLWLLFKISDKAISNN